MNYVLLKLLASLLDRASPEILEGARSAAKRLKVRAADTPNPVDDVLADLLCALVGVED